MLKAILFDLDGTLGETIPVCIEAFRLALEPYVGRKMPDEEIYSHFGASDEGLIERLAPDNYDDAMASYLRHYAELHDQTCPHPFPGIPEVLAFLRDRGVFLAMVTGKGARSAAISLERFGLAGFFRDFEAGTAAGPSKPLGMRKIMERNRLRPEETAYVGDVASDIAAAREAGVTMFSAAWAGSADAGKLAVLRPDRLFRTVDEFAAFLHGMYGE